MYSTEGLQLLLPLLLLLLLLLCCRIALPATPSLTMPSLRRLSPQGVSCTALRARLCSPASAGPLHKEHNKPSVY
jgi:hypothetical protein